MGDASVRDLIDAYLDGDADEPRVRALEAWIAADPAHADRFAFETFLHAQLRDQASQGLLPAVPDLAAGTRPGVVRHPRASDDPPERPRGAAAPARRPGGGGRRCPGRGHCHGGRALAADGRRRARTPPGGRQVARGPAAPGPAASLARSSGDARVFSRGEPVAAGAAFAAGWRSEVRAGIAELDLPGGVQVILEAPAAFELVAGGGLRLDGGKLLARVPGGQTFTVDTATATLVNRGTEAGVEVAGGIGGQTTVEVFSGVVDAYPGGGGGHGGGGTAAGRLAAAPLAQLGAGDAKQISMSAAVPTVRDVAPAARPEWVRRFFGRDGVVSIGGPAEMRLLRAPPPSVGRDALEDADRVVVFRERAGYVLPHDVAAHLNAPGRNSWAGTTPVVIPAGTVVDSYLVHYDSPLPADESPGWRGASIRFERPVLGVLWTPGELAATDGALGAPPTRYPGPDRAVGAATVANGQPQRFRVGPETTPGRPVPRFNRDNLCWLSVHFPHRGGFAQYRVLVRSAGG